MTCGTGAAHLLSFLGTPGLFSTATIPDLAHVHHCGDRDAMSVQKPAGLRKSRRTTQTVKDSALTCTGEPVSHMKRPTDARLIFIADSFGRAGGRTPKHLSWGGQTHAVSLKPKQGSESDVKTAAETET